VYEYAASVDVLGRWWNGAWGDSYVEMSARARDAMESARTSRRLRHRQTHRVDFATEVEARAMVERLLRAEVPGRWREMDSARSLPLGYKP
jgi:hypothetical protein